MKASPRTQDAHAALRDATATRHADIDALLALRRPLVRTHYVRVLQGFAAFLARWEPCMARALPPHWQDWFAQTRRLPLVHRDLAALGASRITAAVVLPSLDSGPAALGSLYVLEGSALGGQFIAAQARRQLGLTPDNGAAYFSGCGAATMTRWREFLDRLAADVDAAPEGRARAVQAAQDTFDALADTFRQGLATHERAAA
ncbi:MAG: biliverdin-producing heme oxygenase [Ramlibacter sp.]